MIITREGAIVLAWCIFLDHHWKKPRQPPAGVIPTQQTPPATVRTQ